MAALIGVKPGVAGAVGAKAPKTSGFTVQVPLDLLSEDGVPPQTGDDVSFSVDGTVQSADSENATVKIESVNGQPVDESSAQEAQEDSGAPPGSSAAMRPSLASAASQGGLGTGLGQ